jgi:hypothetical protein
LPKVLCASIPKPPSNAADQNRKAKPHAKKRSPAVKANI